MMRKYICSFLMLFFIAATFAQPSKYRNLWDMAPKHIPNTASVDAPLLGNGDITVSVGRTSNGLRYYLSKNDFWRLQSKAEHLSGPRVAGYLDIQLSTPGEPVFRAQQSLFNGMTTCYLKQDINDISVTSWVAATENVTFITLQSERPVTVSFELNAPVNQGADLTIKDTAGVALMRRAFTRNVDIATEVAVAVKAIGKQGHTINLSPGIPVTLALSFESKFRHKSPSVFVVGKTRSIIAKDIVRLKRAHDDWWQTYWSRSSLTVSDTVLMKAYYQGLYTMGSCSRDRRFPPAIFGWNTTDDPTWNGDYHLNYNFYAPFYALYSANRLEQAAVQEAPLLDFMPRGKYYAQQVTGTRGVLYPVGIGPLGVEVTRDFPVGTDNGYTLKGDVESGGLFYKQRSNAVFGTVNLAQRWRYTYDHDYGRSIYPYILSVIDFWEDYLRFENGRYVIYNDAQNEKSGFNTNPLMTIALLRNALDLMLDLSKELGRDAPRRAKWRDMLEKLSQLPKDTRNGKTVFRGAEADSTGKQVRGVSYSAIYPANAITLDSDAGDLAAARNSVAAIARWDHHNSTNSFYMAAVRVGYDPLVIFNELHKYALRTYPNGFQLDNPHGIENACTVANALQEMYCMSIGGRIRLFSVWPSGQDAGFQNMRTWGAFLVSARIKGGVISGVMIKSERGKDCQVVNPWPGRNVVVIREGKNAQKLKGNILKFKTVAGEQIRLAPL